MGPLFSGSHVVCRRENMKTVNVHLVFTTVARGCESSAFKRPSSLNEMYDTVVCLPLPEPNHMSFESFGQLFLLLYLHVFARQTVYKVVERS